MSKLLGLAYTEAALKSLERIEPQKVRRQIKNRIDALMSTPYPQGCVKLRGVLDDERHEVFRIRQGDYRVLYVVREGTEIVILDIGHRREIYK